MSGHSQDTVSHLEKEQLIILIDTTLVKSNNILDTNNDNNDKQWLLIVICVTLVAVGRGSYALMKISTCR